MKLSAYEVGVKGTDWTEMLVDRSPGAAKYRYLHRVQDAWPSVRFTDLTCRQVGKPSSSPGFIRNAEYRGMPGLRCGDAVSVHGRAAFVVGHDSSANFEVLFDDGSRGSVHPSDL